MSPSAQVGPTQDWPGWGRNQTLNLLARKMPVTVPEGICVGFIPESGTISQDVTFPTSGVYRLTFDTATRHGAFDHTYEVKLEGELIHQVKTTDRAFRQVELTLPACFKRGRAGTGFCGYRHYR